MASGRSVALHALVALFIASFATVVRLPSLSLGRETKKYLGYSEDSLLNFTELSGRYGYAAEEHRVVTEDGYILTIFRMSRGVGGGGVGVGRGRGRPVLLMHGLLQSADAWLDAGPGAGLAYLLADAGHDLWVGNARGNYYSRRHVRLDPDADADFWKFSVDEIGAYDVPATVDYVLEWTRADKVNYVGFSQGAGAFLIMCSERPGHCDKAGVLIGLAPASRQTNTKSVPYRTLTETVNALENLLSFVGVQEVFSKGAFGQEFMEFLCHFDWLSGRVCGTAEALFDSFHPGSIAELTLKVLFGHFPAGTSLHNLARYGQSMSSDSFQKFDYGPEGNRRRYGGARPPRYNLSAVSVPVVALYGAGDRLVDARDVAWLLARLPNVQEAVEVADPLWNHLDVTYSRFTKDRIFPKIEHYLLKYSNG